MHVLQHACEHTCMLECRKVRKAINRHTYPFTLSSPSIDTNDYPLSEFGEFVQPSGSSRQPQLLSGITVEHIGRLTAIPGQTGLLAVAFTQRD